ncbi:hypothetical protein [Haloferula sp. A504]|uniref:hypothetical protein n=1 Tax=Haloferula sp. A504 TaxID=3373601 RepID=UPI0031C48F96|nr:hypothetical protein [Verrucomicrobiaceae bacterium E54]
MRILLILLTLFPLLGAQERERTFRTLFLNGPQRAASKYFLFDGTNCREVRFPRMSLSPVYELPAGDLRITLLTSPVSRIEEVPEGSPAVTIPAAMRDFYLLISRDPSNEVVPLRMQAVNANYDRIGRGEMLWFNLTPKFVKGTLGRASLELPPKKMALVKEPARELGNYPVEIYFRVPGDERTHPLIESQWNHDPRARSIVFVYDEGKRRAPRVQAFSDFRYEDPVAEP